VSRYERMHNAWTQVKTTVEEAAEGMEDVQAATDARDALEVVSRHIRAMLALEDAVREALRHWPAPEAARLLYEGLERVERAREEGR